MRIAVLGPLEVLTDDLAPIVVPGAKERLVLGALVAAAPGVVSADRLIGTLWNGEPPASARKSLQAHLVHLRSSLEPDRPRGSTGRYVVRRGPGYALALGRTAVDVLLMGDLAARGQARLASGDAADAARQLTAALDLWRGEPYADWPDAPFAEVERERLTELRSCTRAALLEARVALGEHLGVLPQLQGLVTEEPLREDWWRLLMLALYRAGRQGDAMAAGRRARALLAEELGAEPGRALRDMEAAVLAQDPALEPAAPRVTTDVPARPTGSCPYKGLATYQVADAPLFHGRQRLVGGLVGRLVDAPLLVVSGPSGAGKSSVVRAGLLPALANGAVPGSAAWRPVVITPGRRPVDALAELTGDTPPASPTILVIDQFEELWAAGTEPAERIAFLDAVLGLLDDGIVERCVIVVRGDHVGRLAEHATFTERLGGALVLVPPLTDPELRDIVQGPAGDVGLAVEPELLDVVVTDVLGRPGALPLLSTALVGTWERRRGPVLSLAGYLDAGGVSGALTRTAEAAYAGLGPEGQEDARRLLVRLADVDDGGALVRRAVPLSELDFRDVRAAPLWQVVENFVDRRLLSVDGDHLEVTHEALLAGWPRLVRWLEDDAAGRAVRRHLAPAAQHWEAQGRPSDELYRGARLAAALDWVSGRDADATAIEREFLTASQAQSDTELREAHEQVARERTARRRTRRLAVGLAAVLVVALVAAVSAVRFQRAAEARAAEIERNSLTADAIRLAALSGVAPAVDLSLLLAAQAFHLVRTPETEDALLGSLLRHERAVASVTVNGDLVDSALGGRGTLFYARGQSIFAWPLGEAGGRSEPRRLTGSWTGGLGAASPTEDLLVDVGLPFGPDPLESSWVRLLSAEGTPRFLVGPGELEVLPFGVSFTGDGSRVVLLGSTGTPGRDQVTWSVTEFDVETGAARDTGISGTFPPDTTPVPAADISEDGRTAVVYDEHAPSASATLVSLTDGRQVSLQVPRRPVDTIGFRAGGSGAAQLWADGAVTIYDPIGRPVQQVRHLPGPVSDVVAAPDGTWAATVGGEGTVALWDVDPSTAQWTQRESFGGHADDVLEAEITADGRRLVTRGADDRIVVWDVTRDGGFGTPVAGDWNRWLVGPPEAVEPGELSVALTQAPPDLAGGVAPTAVGLVATFFEPRTGKIVDRVEVGNVDPDSPYAPSMAVSPGGGMVAISTGSSTTVLDTGTRARLATFGLPPDGEVGSDGRPQTADSVSCLSWTPDASRLLLCTTVEPAGQTVGDIVGNLVVVEPTTGAEDRRVSLAGILPESIAVSRDLRVLAVAAGGGLVQLVDALTLEPERVISTGDVHAAEDLSFSPDGRRIALAGADRHLHVIDTTTRETSEELVPFGQDFGQVEWLADNRTVALAGSDGRVSLFDTERGQLRAPPLSAADDGTFAPVQLIVEGSDALVAMTGTSAGRRWPLDPSVWAERACAVAGRALTRTEWNQYLPARPYRPVCGD